MTALFLHTHTHCQCTQARANPLPSTIPPRVVPQQPYKFRQPPAPITPLPQHGGGQIYQPHEAAEMYAHPQHFSRQPYVEGEHGHVRGQPMYQAPTQGPQQPVSYRQPMYDLLLLKFLFRSKKKCSKSPPRSMIADTTIYYTKVTAKCFQVFFSEIE